MHSLTVQCLVEGGLLIIHIGYVDSDCTDIAESGIHHAVVLNLQEEVEGGSLLKVESGTE